MTAKKVHGLGSKDYAQKAVEAAFKSNMAPSYVDAWVKWFDGATADGAERDPCELCRDGALGGCGTCAYLTPQASDLPEPEYYAADLEEVARAVLKRTEDALRQLFVATGMFKAMPPVVQGLIDAMARELETVGYVEALLPE